MKYCSRFTDYLYLDHYNGDVWMCQWMNHADGVIGNILKDKVEDIYNSEKANELRKSMDDQSFCHCRMEACPYLQNNELPDLSEEEYEKTKRESYYPKEINLAYDFVCNQSCETCRESVFIPPKGYAESMANIKDKILPSLDKAKRITASGHGDPFASPYMMEVLENMHPSNPELEILLETNGVFFDEEHWERIKHLGKIHLEIVVTINSFDEFTYKHISRGGNYKKVMHNLEFISKLRESGDIDVLSLSAVIQDRNFREMPSFAKRALENYAFDKVVLKPVYQWGTMDDKVFWFKDVLNPMHPYHSEYLEILQDPIMHDKRVYNFGGDTEHPARPYPSGNKNKYFPYEDVKNGEKIIVYGAGQIGKSVVASLREDNYCEVVAWIDKHPCSDEIHTPDYLNSGIEYDHVVIGTLNRKFASEMKTKLIEMGIEESKIVACRSDI